MGLYIPNIELPKEGYIQLDIHSDGTVFQYSLGKDCGKATIVATPHGDLIDRKAFDEHMKKTSRFFDTHFDLMEMPVIIKEEK